MSAQKITIEGFLDEFKQRHEQMADRAFCWVLGSGASIESGIPSGKTLASQWLSELHKREDFTGLPIQQWATPENLGIPRFEYTRVANFYPWIYQRRFRDYKEQGYAFLEKTMDHAEPSFGYSVLAQIMATTPHKVAVTTNFDNLIADALSIYTRIFPLVCGHESLTGYIRPTLRRPLVAKIHRDLLLAPLSNPEDVARLPGEWDAALKKIFERFTPIVIGYGGNDGSLMGFLETLTAIEGGIFWCYREGSEVDQKVDNVIEHHSGRLVPIAGFDEVMLQLQETLQLPFLLPVLQSVHNKRAADYQKQFEELTKKLRQPAQDPVVEEARKPARQAAEAAVQRLTKEKNWWAWQLKADAESDPIKKEKIYRLGLEDFPNSCELMGNLGVFFEDQEKYKQAQEQYHKAYEISPDDNIALANEAWSLHEFKKDYGQAEILYKRAVELDSSQVNVLCNYALFLFRVRRDFKAAEALYRKALELEPAHLNTLEGLAILVAEVKKDFDEAERLHNKTMELEPANPAAARIFAHFLNYSRKDYDRAEEFYRKAIELDPDDADSLGAFAVFFEKALKKPDEAEKLYREALRLQPEDPTHLGNFAQLLAAMRRPEEAKRIGDQAWRFLDSNPNVIHAEVAFTRWLVERAALRNGNPALGRLKAVLQTGFIRSTWSFNELLSTMLPLLPADEQSLGQKLADAILDEEKVDALANETIWQATQPIPLDLPWLA